MSHHDSELRELDSQIRELEADLRDMASELRSSERESRSFSDLVGEYDYLMANNGFMPFEIGNSRHNIQVERELTAVLDKGRELIEIEKACDDNENVAEAFDRLRMLMKLCRSDESNSKP